MSSIYISTNNSDNYGLTFPCAISAVKHLRSDLPMKKVGGREEAITTAISSIDAAIMIENTTTYFIILQEIN